MIGAIRVIGIDTNVLVRYFTLDDSRQAAAATRFIERGLSAEQQGHVCHVSLAELAWVLRSNYDADAEEVTRAMMFLLTDARFFVDDKSSVWMALDIYRDGGVDFGDAMIAAVARRRGCSKTMTFDRKATRIPGMTLLT